MIIAKKQLTRYTGYIEIFDISLCKENYFMADLLNIKSALEMLGDDKELLRELFTSFIKDKPFDKFHLLRLEKKTDKTEAAKYVHLYKGAGRQIGAERLAKSGQALEDVLRKKTEGNIEELTEDFEKDLRLTFAAVKDALEVI